MENPISNMERPVRAVPSCSGVKQQFIIDVLGVHYNGATPQQMKQSETLAESMPHWPDPGSVAEKDGIIIVNF